MKTNSSFVMIAVCGAALFAGAGCKGSEAKGTGGGGGGDTPFKITQFGLQMDLPGTTDIFTAASSAKKVSVRNSNLGIINVALDERTDDEVEGWKSYADKEKCTGFTSEKLADGWTVLFTCTTQYGPAVTGKVGKTIAGHTYSCELSSSPKTESEARSAISKCKTLRAI